MVTVQVDIRRRPTRQQAREHDAMIIIFSGSIGRFPLGGHAWANMQYLAGLRELGHDVYYLEECGQQSWVYDWQTEKPVTELRYPAGYVHQCLELIGLQDRWIYRAGDQSAGMPLADFLDVCGQADLMIVRAVPLALWRPEYVWPRRRVFIDVDPGFTQVSLVRGDRRVRQTVAQCERLFTIARRLGAEDCSIPTGGKDWIPTVSPVWLPAWPPADTNSTHVTLVLQWKSFSSSHRYGKLSYNGIWYRQKNEEFLAYLELPRRTDQRFRMALTGGPLKQLAAHGWEVVPGWQATQTPCAYRQFIRDSRAELGIAKHGYVQTRGGWFSDRSACYLASGKPVVLQDTGLADWLPTGEGILPFGDLDGAIGALEAIRADYPRHQQAARRLAEEYFSTHRVLPPLLEKAMN
jgi:hypothetical protein